MKYKAILFDMDGVLIESEFLMRSSAIQALADYGIEAQHEDFLEFTGMGEDRFVGGVAEKHGHQQNADQRKADQGPVAPEKVGKFRLDPLGTALSAAAGGSMDRLNRFDGGTGFLFTHGIGLLRLQYFTHYTTFFDGFQP